MPSPKISKIRFDHSKRMDRLKLRMIYKRRPRDFGETSVCQTLKFRNIYLVISRRYREYTSGQDQFQNIVLNIRSGYRYQQTEVIDIFLYLGAMYLNFIWLF